MPSKSIMKYIIGPLLVFILLLWTQGPQMGRAYVETGMTFDPSSIQTFTSPSNDFNIVATMSFSGDWTSQVIGNMYHLVTIVDGSENPHAYEPSTREETAVLEADLLIRMGLQGLEPWLPDILEANSDLEDKTLSLIDSSMIEYDDLIKANNPHVWMNPSNTKIMVEKIYDAVVTLDDTWNTTLFANKNSYLGELDQLLGRMNTTKTHFQGMKVVVHHPAFKYLFDMLGIIRVASIEEHEGGHASPQHLDEVRQEMKDEGVEIIVTQPQLKGEWDEIHQLARDTGSKVVYATPLLGVYGLNSYIDMIDYNLDALMNPVNPPHEETPGFMYISAFLSLIAASILVRQWKK